MPAVLLFVSSSWSPGPCHTHVTRPQTAGTTPESRRGARQGSSSTSGSAATPARGWGHSLTGVGPYPSRYYRRAAFGRRVAGAGSDPSTRHTAVVVEVPVRSRAKPPSVPFPPGPHLRLGTAWDAHRAGRHARPSSWSETWAWTLATAVHTHTHTHTNSLTHSLTLSLTHSLTHLIPIFVSFKVCLPHITLVRHVDGSRLMWRGERQHRGQAGACREHQGKNGPIELVFHRVLQRFAVDQAVWHLVLRSDECGAERCAGTQCTQAAGPHTSMRIHMTVYHTDLPPLISDFMCHM